MTATPSSIPVLGVVSGGGSDGGFVGGGQIGYNYQFNQFVIGLETDIQYADLGNGRSLTFGQGFAGNNNNGNWFGTVRARAGFAFDRALVYATGGLAYGDIGKPRSAAFHRSGRNRVRRQRLAAPTPAGCSALVSNTRSPTT